MSPVRSVTYVSGRTLPARELFSGFGPDARFPGLFIDWANSKWALETATKAKLSLFRYAANH
jgi:hypothetical protein